MVNVLKIYGILIYGVFFDKHVDLPIVISITQGFTSILRAKS